jgi:NADH-quinone oxidoreductase subunit G
VRLFDVKDGEKPSYFQANFSSVKALGAGEVLVVPIHHVFGSEELSVRAPGIAGLCPAPYVAVNTDDAHTRNLQDGQMIGISFPGIELHFPVRINESLPPGVAGLPAGVQGLSGIKLPACGYLFSDDSKREKT